MIGTVIKTLSSSTHKGIKCVVMQIWISLKTTFDNGVDDPTKVEQVFHYESVFGVWEKVRLRMSLQ